MKEKFRLKIIEFSNLLNMMEVCRKAGVDQANYTKFKNGDLGKLSEKKILEMVKVINGINLELEDVPVTGTKGKR